MGGDRTGESVMLTIPKKAYPNHNDELKELSIGSLEAALALLLKERNYDFDSISVSELCHKAGVSRNAFYSHFRSKTQVMDRLLDEIHKEIIGKTDILFDPKMADLAFYERIFEALSRRLEMLKIYVRGGYQLRAVKETYYALRLSGVSAEEQQRRFVWFVSLEALIASWLMEKERESIEAIAQTAYQKLTPLLS